VFEITIKSGNVT